MFICRECAGYFSRPSVDDFGFDHAFGRFINRREVCPYCESLDIEEAQDCPNCTGGKKLHDDILCPSCRAALYKRFVDFCDELTEEEEDQLDEWLDGESVKNRGEFYDGRV